MFSPGIICYFVYLPQTTAYINATGFAFTTAQKDGIDRFFKDITGVSNPSYTTFNVLSKMVVLYPSLTGTSVADKINMVNPGSYSYTETGSPTYNTSTKSVAFNGTTQYLDTTFTPNGELTTFANSDFTGYGIHRVDTNIDTNATSGEVSGGNSYAFFLGGAAGPGVIQMILSAQTANSTSKAFPTNSWYMASWASSTTINAYANGTNINTQTLTWNNTPTLSSYIGGYHSGGGANYGGPSTVDMYFSVRNTWSDAEVTFIYKATKALKVIFGITWT